MSKNEILFSLYGEMLDMITCKQIEDGILIPKKQKSKFEDVIRLK
nr:MAG TPA: hypothetical protein [Bacteriophage sp.]